MPVVPVDGDVVLTVWELYPQGAAIWLILGRGLFEDCAPVELFRPDPEPRDELSVLPLLASPAVAEAWNTPLESI